MSNIIITHAQIIIIKGWSEVAQSCLTLCDPMDCSLPGSSVHGIFQAKILEWVAISFFRGSSQPRDWTRVSHIVGRCLKVSGSIFWEVMDMFIALIVVMVSWYTLACKLIELYTFNRYNFLFVKYTSDKWFTNISSGWLWNIYASL